jgi:phage terminase small subunit
MPRRSKASLTIASITLGLRRLEPPADLQGPAREIFRQTVASVAANHFQPDDLPLLCTYCAAAAQALQAAIELRVCPLAGDRPSPWLRIQASAARTMAQMSVRLRLGARSRDHHPRRARSQRPPSYYSIIDGDPEPAA